LAILLTAEYYVADLSQFLLLYVVHADLSLFAHWPVGIWISSFQGVHLLFWN